MELVSEADKCMEQVNIDSDRFPLVKPRLRYTDTEALRGGKGFSHGEIRGAAASIHDMKTAGLPIDHRRRSVHDFNVSALKGLLGKTTGRVSPQKSRGRTGKKQGKRLRGKSRASKKKQNDR